MNILFISFDADPPYMGGVATMTNILAKEFIKMGHSCSLAYLSDSKWPSTFFHDKIKLTRDNLPAIESYGKEHKFDLIISQFVAHDFNLLESLRSSRTKLIIVHHSRPHILGLQIDTLKTLFRDNHSLAYRTYTLAKIILLPLLNFIKYKKEEKESFVISYEQCDKFVLLSKNFFGLFKDIVKTADLSKMAFIGNPSTFEHYYDTTKLDKKKKTLLVVSCVTSPKNILEMFKIWQQIEMDRNLDKWNFVFVGEGDGFDLLRREIKKMNLKRVTFTGFADPQPYYKDASITMMTSHYEGWPMVLLESQQMGVVPIVYNSFESLPDIVIDGETGFVVPYMDRGLFLEKLKKLMNNDILRNRMAHKCIEVSVERTKEKCALLYLEAVGLTENV